MNEYELTKYRGEWCLGEKFSDDTKYIYPLSWLDEDEFDGAKVIPVDQKRDNLFEMTGKIELDADGFEEIQNKIDRIEREILVGVGMFIGAIYDDEEADEKIEEYHKAIKGQRRD